MAGSSSSSGNSWGWSYSDPHAIQTPQSEWGMQLSQSLAAIMNQMIQWAQAQYARGSQVTDQNIQQFLDQAGQAAGFANNLLSRYTSIFEPLEDQFVKAAQSYNSEARQKFMMGQAESTAAQADQAGMDATKRALQEAGVNVNSGKYAELTAMERMKDAATRAGAGTQAFMNTEQMGRQMMQTAIQFGQNVPGMWATAANTRTAALNAAQQAILGLLNTGANMLNVGANYGNASANANRIPPIGNTSQSQQGSGQHSGSVNSDPNQHSNNRQQPSQHMPQDPGDRSSRGTQSSDPRFKDPANMQMKSNPFYNADKKIIEVPPGGDQGTGESGMDKEFNPFNSAVDPSQQTAIPDGQGGWIPLDQSRTGQGGMDQEFNPFNSAVDPMQQNASADGQGGWIQQDQTGTGQSGMDQEFDAFGNNASNVSNENQNIWDQASQTQGFDQSGMDQEFNMFGNQDQTGSIGQDWGQQDQQQQDWGGQQDQQSWDQFSGDQQDQTQQDLSQNWDSSSWGDSGDYSDYGYAKGGVVPTTGGHVPRSASPSRGRQTDDIPARLNADEFVIPKDVHLHRGTKFFNNLIAQSRKARTGMAGPKPQAKMRPPLRMKPTFTSRYMGQ